MNLARHRGSCAVATLIGICFLARGLFYCSFLPLWEGYDEWAHFAYIERLATHGGWLVDRNEHVSREVTVSLQRAPVPWELRNMPNPSVTEDAYWRLSPEERAERQRDLNTIPQSLAGQEDLSGPPIYEALQPPLYYWLLSIPYRLAGNISLVNRVFLLRCLSLFIGALSIPLVFLIAVRVTGSSRVAAGALALVALMPELMVDLCRVGNECLGIVLYSWLSLLCLDFADDAAPRKTGLWTGIALGLGLITKAYFLTAIPALIVLYIWRFRQTRDKAAIAYGAGLTFGPALLIAGWWYARNRVTTGTWSGLSESVILAHYTPAQYLAGIMRLPWRRAIDSILVSHIWYGSWSSLGLRSWMYHLFFAVAAVASAGIALVLLRSRPVPRSALYPILSLYGFFWAGELWNAVLIFLSRGGPTSMGWYMYCVVAAEVTLLVVGLRALAPGRLRFVAIPALIIGVAAMDLYSVNFVSIPYYAGLTAHLPNGSIPAFQLARLHQIGVSDLFHRLGVNKASWVTPFALEAGWSCYVAATAVLAAITVGIWWKPEWMG